MSQILTVVVERAGSQVSVTWLASDGLSDQAALAALQAVERALQKRVLRAELETEQGAGRVEEAG